MIEIGAVSKAPVPPHVLLWVAADDRLDRRVAACGQALDVAPPIPRGIEFERRLEQRAEPAAQARVILEAQLAEPPAPLLSPIPPGTQLLALYLTERGDAIVDLSEEVTLGHSGGSLEELFTVYAIVNALTTNLPVINAVQILINGREVDTLVGHVDLQSPLERNMQWVADPNAEPTPEAEPALEVEATPTPTI